MLIPMRLAEGIRAGDVTVAFRSWKRPTVKAGGTLTIGAIGQMAIDAVTAINQEVYQQTIQPATSGQLQNLTDSLFQTWNKHLVNPRRKH